MMHIITSTTSATDTMSCINTLHMYRHQIKSHGKAFHLLQNGPGKCGLRRKFAKTIAKTDRDEGFARLDVYKKWFKDTFFTTKDDSVLIVMPQESVQPRYRDEVPKYVNLNPSVNANPVNSFEHPPSGVNCLTLAAVLEAPALTIPSKSEVIHLFYRALIACVVAEIPYNSRVTELEEKLPFSVTVMGNAGA